jgi:hypothetical protein
MMDEQDVFSSWRNSPEKAAYDAKGMMQTADYRPQNYTDPVTGQVFKLDDRSGTFADYYKKTYGRDLAVEDDRFRGLLGSGLGGILDESKSIQAPVGIENRMVGEPEPIPQAPAEDIQASINYLAGLPKMNIPQIPDIEEIKRKMAEANMNFPEPVSYQDQLQAIRDLPPMNQMPTREEIQMAMQNIPVPEKAFTPAQTIQEKIQMAMQNIPVPEKAFTPAQTIQEKIQAVMQNMPVPEKAFTPAQTIQEKIQMAMQNMPTPIPEPMVFPSIPKFSSPVPQMPTREEIQAAMQNIPTPTAPVSSMPKFNLPQMQSFGLPQQIAGGRTLMSDFSPRNVMRMANGGGIDQAIYDLKFKLNG